MKKFGFSLGLHYLCSMNQKNRILEQLDIRLNEMQEQAYEAIRKGADDVVILSPTGSGKTLAYLLPLVELLNEETDDVQALVVVPGRELALQSDTVLKRMGTGLRSQSCYGGRTAMDEHRVLKQVKPHVVFGTPGRLNDHLQKQNISPYSVRLLIIDEFDKCLEMGFHLEMERLLGNLPGVRRRILLSATDAEAIPAFVRLKQVKRIDFLHEEQVSAVGQASMSAASRITVYQIRSPKKDKLETLKHLLLSLGEASSIVFLNYRDSVERVNDYLSEQGFSTSFFHGGLEQKQREAALYRFSNGSVNVLVSTDLASRGLDIPDVANIIHYHLPESDEGYVHRVGRTARWHAKGNAYFILNADEQVPDYVDADVKEFQLSEPSEDGFVPQPRMATIYIGKGKKDKLSRGDVVGFLCKKGGLTAQDIGRIDVNDRYCYAAVVRTKLKQLLSRVSGEKIKGVKTIIEEVH